MTRTCQDCGAPAQKRRCRHCSLEHYHGTPADDLDDDAGPSMAADRAYLPWPARGYEVLVIRDWRDSVRRRHAAAEGVAT